MLEQKDIQAIAELIHASEERMTERMTGKITEAIAASEERMTERMTGKINEAITASEKRMKKAIRNSEKRTINHVNLILGVDGDLEERIARLEESVAELKLWRETQKSKNQDYDTLQMQIDDLRNKFELEMQTRKSA